MPPGPSERTARRALLSVSDKTGLVDFARGLAELGIELIASGGTAEALRGAGLDVIEVSELTGSPEMLGGRVKTLHPRVHGGLLARRDHPGDKRDVEAQRLSLIDLVVISLYPFEATVARPGVSLPEAIEQIDVGGPAMIRAAAKNHAAVAVVTDASQYATVLAELRSSHGALSEATLHGLAQEAFRRTAQYDAAIASYLQRAESAIPSASPGFPERLPFELERVSALRYGENPHQGAAFYRQAGRPAFGLGNMRQLHGPELGYNNLLDLSAALGLLLEFADPAAVVIKHTNPCGAARGLTVAEAMVRAKASDPVSIYGGIVGVNRTLDLGVVAALSGIFVEILFAPAFAPDALEELARTKKKCRVLEVPCQRPPTGGIELRSVLGGLLAQDTDDTDLDPAALRVVTRRQPTTEERTALGFAWRVAKHVKSNAIVLTTPDQVIGVGAGQMNRLDSARLAVLRAGEAKLSTQGAVCASDAFFPFRDGLDVVARAGITAVIEPGGSLRDAEGIAGADEPGVTVLFTGIRHFRH